MANITDKRIDELPVAASVGDSDLFVIEQGGAAKKALGSVVKGAIGGSSLPSGGTPGQVLTKTSSGAEWSDAGTPTQAQTDSAVADWLDAHPEATTTVQDGSITEIKLAPAVATKLNRGGLSNEAKAALLALLEKVAYVDENGQQYWDALHEALYPPANLVFISAVFNQGDAVIYDTYSLDTLRQYLTVTAHMEDGTTQPVSNYTLSGTLTAGTSTITVSYGGKTDTFSVTVSRDASGPVEMSAFMQHNTIRESGFGHYSDGGNTAYSDARFPTNNGWTSISDVFDNDANIKVTFTPSANAFQCWLFGSTNFDNSFSLSYDNGGDYWLKYITPSSDTFAYGWSTAPHTFTASVKAGCRFMIMGIMSSSHDISNFTVEVI